MIQDAMKCFIKMLLPIVVVMMAMPCASKKMAQEDPPVLHYYVGGVLVRSSTGDTISAELILPLIDSINELLSQMSRDNEPVTYGDTLSAYKGLESLMFYIHRDIAVDTLRRFYNGIGEEYLLLEVRDLYTKAQPEYVSKDGAYHIMLYYHEGMQYPKEKYYTYEVEGFRIISEAPYFAGATQVRKPTSVGVESDTISIFECSFAVDSVRKNDSIYRAAEMSHTYTRKDIKMGTTISFDIFDVLNKCSLDGSMPEIK